MGSFRIQFNNQNSCECIGSEWNDYGYRTSFKVVLPDGNRVYIKAITPNFTPDVQGPFLSYIEKVKQALSEKSLIIFVGSNLEYYQYLANLIEKGCITGKDYRKFLNDNNLVDLFFNYPKIKDIEFDKDVLRVIKKSLFRCYQFKSYDEYFDMLDRLRKVTYGNHYINFLDFFDLNNFTQNVGEKLFLNENIYLWDEFIQKLTWKYLYSTGLYSTIVNYLLNSGRSQLIDNWPVADVLYLRWRNDPSITIEMNKLFPAELNDIISEIRRIEDSLRIAPDFLQGNRLCQYISVASIRYLINNNSLENKLDGSNFSPAVLRLTNSNQMNDPLEGRVFLDYFKSKVTKTDSEDDYVPSSAFISSASGSIDKLSLWQEYADDAKGVCLIYDNDFLSKNLLKDGLSKKTARRISKDKFV